MLFGKKADERSPWAGIAWEMLECNRVHLHNNFDAVERLET